VKHSILALLAFAVACSNSDATSPIGTPNDISSMNVGDVRVLTPDQVPNGIDLPASSVTRDYVIIVGNTNPTIDAVANFAVRADRTTGGSANVAASATLNAPPVNARLVISINGKCLRGLVVRAAEGESNLAQPLQLWPL